MNVYLERKLFSLGLICDPFLGRGDGVGVLQAQHGDGDHKEWMEQNIEL